MRAGIRILAALGALIVPATAAAQEPRVTEFNDGLLLSVGAWDIAAGKDGNLWFTEELSNAFTRITPSAVLTEFPGALLGGSPRGIAAGPDGNMWLAQAAGDGAITRVTPTGQATNFAVGLTPGDPWDITAGPDGNMWFVNRSADLIGRITPEGEITEFTALDPGSQPSAIALGADGNLWFTETGAGKIGRITPGGEITEFSSGLSGSSAPTDITAGPDNALWFTLNADPGGIGRIDKHTGEITIFTDGITPNSRPVGITKGPDDALWFTESAGAGAIGRITTGGDVTEYTAGLTPGLAPWLIAAGPDGNVWFTQNALLGRVARITLPPIVRSLGALDVGHTSATLRARVRPNSQATDYHFEYGQTSAYGATTETAYAGNGYLLKGVQAAIGGLTPGTEYHYRLVATNDSGTTYGPDRVFETLRIAVSDSSVDPVPDERPVEPVPDFAETVVAEPEGTVLVKAPGGDWRPLAPGAELPVGAAFDTRRGSVSLTSAGCRGGSQTGTFGGGLFALRQPRSACGRVDVYLRGGNFGSCRRPARRSARGSVSAGASRTRRVRGLWGRDRGGRFRTHGRHSHATVRGTRWVTIDRCDGTLTRVTEGAVVVQSRRTGRRVLVRAGRSHLAKAPRARKSRRR